MTLDLAWALAFLALPLVADAQPRYGLPNQCSAGDAGPTQPILRFTPALGVNPWPLDVITQKTSAQINSITQEASDRVLQTELTGSRGVLVGLTRVAGPKPIVRVVWEWMPATFGGGWCAYLSGGQIVSPRIQMFIAAEYAAPGCAFLETRRHENLHYTDLSDDLRQFQQAARTAWRSLLLPSAGRPWYVPLPARGDAEVAVTSDLDGLIRRALEPLNDEIVARAGQEGRERDRAASVNAPSRKCRSS